jgi:hypothetical protein
MRVKAARAFLVCACLLFLIVVLFLFAFPTWIGGVWHLFKGNATAYAGWTVPVPKGFFAFRTSTGLSIVRMEPYSRRGGRYDILTMATAPSSNYFIFARDFGKFERTEAASARKNGLVERSTKTIPAGNSMRYCIEFGPPDGASAPAQGPEVQISCFLEGEPTTVGYTGKEIYSPDVYRVVQNMFKLPTRKGR